MKNILKYSFLGLGIAAMSSCMDTMDTHPTTVFDAETVWGSKATVEGFVYSTYTDVIHAGYAGSGTSVQWEARTPNSVKCSQVGEGIDGLATELGILEIIKIQDVPNLKFCKLAAEIKNVRFQLFMAFKREQQLSVFFAA